MLPFDLLNFDLDENVLGHGAGIVNLSLGVEISSSSKSSRDPSLSGQFSSILFNSCSIKYLIVASLR